MSCQRVSENGLVCNSLKPHRAFALRALKVPLPLLPTSTPQNCEFSADEAFTNSFFLLLLTKKPTLNVWFPTTFEKSSFKMYSSSLLCQGPIVQRLSEFA